MTPELTWLTLTAILAASLWIPYIVGVNRHAVEGQDAFLRPHDLTAYPAWVHRAHRAHLNLVEQALPFAIVVLIAHQAGVSTTLTIWAAGLFFWLRIAHAVGMISGAAGFPARPLLFTAGWIAILVIAVEVLRA
ncbi:MAPEG family protein [Ovoidimarina sediminis]|uniref:MAPEG family protein n=1 Tax=Ovoidimarina sediminis TaxID=3079856 RepID=UPI00290C261B|nr:MAPEG family protein [Rhodophyticola sp. MJ-SS7]MDU8943421.1 MAPEG family protein [Rhodophyticola sp. MJ-SS7]